MGSNPPVSPESQRDRIVNTMRSVALQEELCAQAEERFRGQFGTIEELLEFLLRDLLRDDAVRADDAERRMIEQRLQDLGYL
jgi:hypothetical protein